MRITMQLVQILRALLDDPLGEHYGLELARAAGLPTGTTYPILARLETAGWLTSHWEDIDPTREGRRPRRYYRLTGAGAAKGREILRDVAEAATGTKTPRPTRRPLPGEAPA